MKQPTSGSAESYHAVLEAVRPYVSERYSETDLAEVVLAQYAETSFISQILESVTLTKTAKTK